jgi:tRNA dimethylallyltransferase
MALSINSLAKNNTGALGLVVICGPTATGKSSLAIALSQRLDQHLKTRRYSKVRRLNSVILSADSRQVYREFNIGTAKPSTLDQKLVPHYLIDLCEPTHTLTVAEYQQQAQELIHQCHEATSGPNCHGTTSGPVIPLLVGGTGLYIRAITKGLKIPRVPPQPELRSQLEKLGQPQCYAMLRQVDPNAAIKIHPNDQVRTLRSLEVFYTTGQPMSAQQGENPPPYPILHIGLDCPEPGELQRRIEQRTHQMVTDGLVAEVETLCQKYGSDLPLLNTLGYAEFKHYLAGKLSLAEAETLTVLHTRQFAKRQRTWFRAIPEIEWFDANAPDLLEQVWQRVEEFRNEF